MFAYKSSFISKLPVLLLCAMLACPLTLLRATEETCAVNENAPQPPPPEVFAEDNDILPPPPPQMHQEGREDAMPDKGRQPPQIHPRIFEYFKQLKESNPEEYRRLKKLQVENPEQFRSEINKLFLSQRKNRLDNTLRNYDRECWEIARKLRANPPPENAAELEEQLKQKIAQSFETMVEHTKKRLEALQKHLDVIQKEREKILKDRFDFFKNAPFPSQNKGFERQPNGRGEFRRENREFDGENRPMRPPRRDATPPQNNEEGTVEEHPIR